MTSSLLGPASSEAKGTLKDSVTGRWPAGAADELGAVAVRIGGRWAACMSAAELERWPPKGIEGLVMRSQPLRAEFAIVFMMDARGGWGDVQAERGKWSFSSGGVVRMGESGGITNGRTAKGRGRKGGIVRKQQKGHLRRRQLVVGGDGFEWVGREVG